MKLFCLTTIALIAFAGNSVLCRLALGTGQIDAASFTVIRLLSGVMVLWGIVFLTQYVSKQNTPQSPVVPNDAKQSRGSSWAALMLFIYAAGFSYAYVSLDTGTGALILFAAVQMTVISTSLFLGHKLYALEWLGIAIAFAGFTYLVLPGAEAPSVLGFAFMAAAGIAWGGYTLLGKSSRQPLADTAYNFLRTVPLVVVLVLATLTYSQLSWVGVLLALASGGVASGVGYVLWYMALEGLTATQAATLQLLVPVLAALGGIVFAGEALTLPFMIASLLILGGILLVITGRYAMERRAR